MPGEALAGLENYRFYPSCGISAVSGNIGPNAVEIIECFVSELVGRGHPSDDQSLCPAFAQYAYGFVGIHEFPAFGLRKTLRNVSGNVLALRKHPVPIPMLFVNDGKCLIKQFIRAHP